MSNELKERSSVELERHLWITSRKYMRGEISMQDLEAVEENHASNLKDAIIALAAQHENWHIMNTRKKKKRGFVDSLHQAVRTNMHAFIAALLPIV